MTTKNFRVGTVCYATEQGLGYLAKAFYDNGIIDHVAVFRHPDNRPNRMEWYPNALDLPKRPFVGPHVEKFIKACDIMLFFETPFDWQFPDLCRKFGVKTVIIPMYEWTLENPPHEFDLTINPSLLDQRYFPNGIFIPIPVLTKYWKKRTIAKKFLHNSGHLGSRFHKGTIELLKAIPLVKSPIEITIRSQETFKMLDILKEFPDVRRDPRVKIELGSRNYETLWDDYDVLVAPEKYNGLSLPLQEAYAAGMMVITTDRFPANTWLPKDPLIPVSDVQMVRVHPGHLEIEESIVKPEDIAKTIDHWYGKDISVFSESGRIWGEENSWQKLGPKFLQTFANLLEK